MEIRLFKSLHLQATYSIVQFLIEKGADIFAKNKAGLTYLRITQIQNLMMIVILKKGLKGLGVNEMPLIYSINMITRSVSCNT